jgi:hypothetical protein
VKTTTTTLKGVKQFQDFRLVTHPLMIDWPSVLRDRKYWVRVNAGGETYDFDCEPLSKWCDSIEKSYSKEATIEVSHVRDDRLIEFRCQTSIIRLVQRESIPLDTEPIELIAKDGIMTLSAVVDLASIQEQRRALARTRKVTSETMKLEKARRILRDARAALTAHDAKVAEAEAALSSQTLVQALNETLAVRKVRRQRRANEAKFAVEVNWELPANAQDQERGRRRQSIATAAAEAMNKQVADIVSLAATLPLFNSDEWDASLARLNDAIVHLGRCTYNSSGWEKWQKIRQQELRTMSWQVDAAYEKQVRSEHGDNVGTRLWWGRDTYHSARLLVKRAPRVIFDLKMAIEAAEADVRAGEASVRKAQDAVDNPPETKKKTSTKKPASKKPVSAEPKRKPKTAIGTKVAKPGQVVIGNLALRRELLVEELQKFEAGEQMPKTKQSWWTNHAAEVKVALAKQTPAS